MENSLPLHECNKNAHKLFKMVTRPHAIIHTIAIAFMVYYRCSFLFLDTESRTAPLSAWLLVFAAELFLSLLWLSSQACRWSLVSRTVFPERLPPEEKFPPIDVFIFTADPTKEPTVGVMNTVISAMALDYPPEKLHVYLSDDGGAAVTLHGMREAWRFARYWIPFCRKFGIKTPCPEAYFTETDSEYEPSWNPEFTSEREKIKNKYEMLKEEIERAGKEHVGLLSSRDHPPLIEVIEENNDDLPDEKLKLPLLVYVSREKRPSHPHNFKAGAINVLLRVSGLISNAPYILFLDCDMHCNDSSSARQAMCFYLDPKLSSSLGFVQFPQMFSNVSKNDIYDCAIRYIFELDWYGFDAAQGPILSGTNFYLNRKAVYGNCNPDYVKELQNSFGQSNEFIKSLQSNCKSAGIDEGIKSSSKLLQEAQIVASCTYEHHTTWGKKVGFLYHTVLEDYSTGFLLLHCKGWRSVYITPSRPAFLGTTTTNFNDLMIQGTRWASGMAQNTFSRFCPFIYAPFRTQFLQWLCYSEFAFIPLAYPSVCCFAVVPQLCLLLGIPLYPEISNPLFFVFPFLLVSALSKQLFEVLYAGRDFQTFKNEHRMWIIKAVTVYLYGTIFAIMEKLGMAKIKFLPTNKIMDDELVRRYEMGIYDFRTSTMFLAPLATIIILNIAALFVGVFRTIFVGGGERMWAQMLLSSYILVVFYPVVEAMFLRKDNGRIPPSVTVMSAVFSVGIFLVGSVVFGF